MEMFDYYMISGLIKDKIFDLSELIDRNEQMGLPIEVFQEQREYLKALVVKVADQYKKDKEAK